MSASIGVSRQVSASQLLLGGDHKQQSKSKMRQKATRSKRCKSLLMLSSPFSHSSTSSMKSSLLSLLQGVNQQQPQPDQQPASGRQLVNSLSCSSTEDETSPTASSSSPAASNSCQNDSTMNQQEANKRTKCIKMKLFEQPLEKLFSPKAIKQLNQANSSPNESQCKRKRFTGSYLKKLYIDPNNNSNSINNHSSQINLNAANRNHQHQLFLSLLPEPIKNLLNELYLRGPSTEGIFRKSPNAKHCKDLRHKLESDSQSSIEQFQVTVIASVFKVSNISGLGEREKKEKEKMLRDRREQSTVDSSSFHPLAVCLASSHKHWTWPPQHESFQDRDRKFIRLSLEIYFSWHLFNQPVAYE